MRYDQACAALAEAASVDEVKAIRDVAEAMRAYARQAKNHSAEADAIAIRMRATRRLSELIDAQKQTVGLATGGEHGGRVRIDGLRANPSIVRPTLAMQGIDKNLAHQARVLGQLSDAEFEGVIADARSQGQSRRAQYSPRDRDRDRAANPIVLAPSTAASLTIWSRSPNPAIGLASSMPIRRGLGKLGAATVARFIPLGRQPLRHQRASTRSRGCRSRRSRPTIARYYCGALRRTSRLARISR